VQEKKSDVKVVDVECNPLKSKYESLYSSFHVSITVDSADVSCNWTFHGSRFMATRLL